MPVLTMTRGSIRQEAVGGRGPPGAVEELGDAMGGIVIARNEGVPCRAARRPAGRLRHRSSRHLLHHREAIKVEVERTADHVRADPEIGPQVVGDLAIDSLADGRRDRR